MNRTHKELGIAYKVYNKIRTTIHQFVKEDDMLSGEVKVDEGYSEGKMKINKDKGVKDKTPALGHLRDKGKRRIHQQRVF